MSPVGQFTVHLSPNRGLPRHLQGDLLTVIRRQQFAIMAADQRLDRPHVTVIAVNERGSARHLKQGWQLLESGTDTAPIGFDQSTGAKLDAAVVTHHHGTDFTDPRAHQLGQDRLARGTGRFAVIAEAINLTILRRTSHKRPAVVASSRMLAFDLVDPLLGRLDGRGVGDQGNEAALLYLFGQLQRGSRNGVRSRHQSPACLVMFSTPLACSTMLSSMRMPPNGRSASTLFQLTRLPCSP